MKIELLAPGVPELFQYEDDTDPFAGPPHSPPHPRAGEMIMGDVEV